MPCDKFRELSLERQLEIKNPRRLMIPENQVAYYIHINPETLKVEYETNSSKK